MPKKPTTKTQQSEQNHKNENDDDARPHVQVPKKQHSNKPKKKATNYGVPEETLAALYKQIKQDICKITAYKMAYSGKLQKLPAFCSKREKLFLSTDYFAEYDDEMTYICRFQYDNAVENRDNEAPVVRVLHKKCTDADGSCLQRHYYKTYQYYSWKTGKFVGELPTDKIHDHHSHVHTFDSGHAIYSTMHYVEMWELNKKIRVSAIGNVSSDYHFGSYFLPTSRGLLLVMQLLSILVLRFEHGLLVIDKMWDKLGYETCPLDSNRIVAIAHTPACISIVNLVDNTIESEYFFLEPEFSVRYARLVAQDWILMIGKYEDGYLFHVKTKQFITLCDDTFNVLVRAIEPGIVVGICNDGTQQRVQLLGIRIYNDMFASFKSVPAFTDIKTCSNSR